MSKKRSKTELGCWLFLDCKILTGKPPQICPNYKSCKYNALYTQNRWCFLADQMWLPETSQLFKVPTLEVDQWVENEAREAGWSPAIDIFYSYHFYYAPVQYYAEK
ncbi:MAG: hypothetical protein KME40_30140 [Komarekiella atlantica HA4396-MV6]|jgi:hypothetical protein|nr:hypothetical protein [Komarekiella atlantica HA4396-MV6]